MLSRRGAACAGVDAHNARGQRRGVALVAYRLVRGSTGCMGSRESLRLAARCCPVHAQRAGLEAQPGRLAAVKRACGSAASTLAGHRDAAAGCATSVWGAHAACHRSSRASTLARYRDAVAVCATSGGPACGLNVGYNSLSADFCRVDGRKTGGGRGWWREKGSRWRPL